MDGNHVIRDELDPSGNTYSFFLPIEAKIRSPTITISSPPTPEKGSNRTAYDLDISTSSFDTIDMADIESDGEFELVYYDENEMKIYILDVEKNGSVKKFPMRSSVQGVRSLRIVDRPHSDMGMIILSRTAGGKTVVEALLGDDLTNLVNVSLTGGLPADSPGFYYHSGSGSILLLNGSSGTVFELDFNSEGNPIRKMKINDTKEGSAIAEADLDGDGDRDILIFPKIGSKDNITICEAIEEHSVEFFEVSDSGLKYWSENLGTTLDIDGDGREEIYTPIGPNGNIATIYLDGSGELKLKWIGMNNTDGIPRSIDRDLYGNGPIFEGAEGFLYISSNKGIYHVLPREGPGSEHINRPASSFNSWGLIGTDDSEVKSFSITSDGMVSYSDVKWGIGEEITMGSFSSETVVKIDLDKSSSALVDLSALMVENDDLPQMTNDAGNTFVRYDLRMEGQDGFLSLNNLNIEYDIEIDASNSILFKPSIEKALEKHNREDVLLMIISDSAGTIKVGPVHVEYDSPPSVVKVLPRSIAIEEGGSGASLFNIRDHIADDFLLPDFKFAFLISDLRNTIQTENVTLIVEPTQDVPILAAGVDEISVEEGSELNIQLSGVDGIFMDPDGEKLSFQWSIENPQPLTLTEHLDISLENNVMTLNPHISGIGGEMRLEIGASDGISTFSEGPLAVILVEINDVDSAPALGSNPGTVYLIEDQDTPSRIPLVGWFLDPDTSLSEYEFNVFSPNPYLETYIKHIGGEPYLFLHPQKDLNGEITIMLEMTGEGTNIMDRLDVVIDPVNDNPEVFVDGKELLKNRGWMVSGHVRDRDSIKGLVEYRVGDGEWISAWGYESWSLIVNFKDLPFGGGFIFIRAYDHDEYSVVTYVKLPIPEYIPEPPKPPIEPKENDSDPQPLDPPGGDDLTGFTPRPSTGTDPPWALFGGLAGIIIAAIFFFGFTEVGIIIMATVGASIYSKLSKKDILNHEIRGLIRGYIIANPGDHYSSIKRNLDLNNGTLAYHLRVLEQSGFIKSMYDGIYKRYYPSNVNISKLKKNVSKQEEIFNIILDNPGVTMEEIGRMIGVSRQVVNYHVKNLIRAGVVSYQRDRKSAKFFPSEEGTGMYEQT